MAKKHKRVLALNVLDLEVAIRKHKAAGREKEILEGEEKSLRAYTQRVEEGTKRLAEVKAALCERLEVDPAKASLIFVKGEPVLEEWTVPDSEGIEHAVEDEVHVEVAKGAFHDLKQAKQLLEEAQKRKAEREAKPKNAAAELEAFLRPLVEKAFPDTPKHAAIELHANDKRLSITWSGE